MAFFYPQSLVCFKSNKSREPLIAAPYLIIYTQYIGICQRVITICCVCFIGQGTFGRLVKLLKIKRFKVIPKIGMQKLYFLK